MLKHPHKNTLWKTHNYYNDNKLTENVKIFCHCRLPVCEIISNNYIENYDVEMFLKWLLKWRKAVMWYSNWHSSRANIIWKDYLTRDLLRYTNDKVFQYDSHQSSLSDICLGTHTGWAVETYVISFHLPNLQARYGIIEFMVYSHMHDKWNKRVLAPYGHFQP